MIQDLENYGAFLERKRQLPGEQGFDPVWMPDFLFDFQRHLVEWACRKGRAAIFADCGLGKTAMQLVWAQNVVQVTNRPVLILTPLAVSHQTVAEAGKFGIDAARSNAGEIPARIVVTNYERLHYFSPEDFGGVVCDESSILKNFAGATREAITAFMQRVQFRLLCTATAAPNDFMELGTSSEALGYMKYREMLSMFFSHDGGETARWSLKAHAAKGPFWAWLCSWARAVRNPADLGFSARGFDLPELRIRRHIVSTDTAPEGFLFNMPAVGLQEQRDERRRTITQRCEMAAEMINQRDGCSIAWCHLNEEGDTLERLIPNSIQVSGSDSDEWKEKAVEWFQGHRCLCGATSESGSCKTTQTSSKRQQCTCGHISGKRVLISKPRMFGYGLNLQDCNHMTFFPSHSFEQWYQAIRRCWRFGQKRPVTVEVISSDGEADVVANLERKAMAADRLFDQIVRHMTHEIEKTKNEKPTIEMRIPQWL